MTITPEEIQQRIAASRERKRQRELSLERIEQRLEELFARPEWQSGVANYYRVANYYLGFGHHLFIHPAYIFKNHIVIRDEYYSISLDKEHISNKSFFADLMDSDQPRYTHQSNLVAVIQRAYRLSQLSSFA